LFEHLSGFQLEGCDVSPEMIARARRQYPTAKTEVGGIELFLQKTGPYGVVVALNVLPYLSEAEEAKFFEHARKITKYLLVSHVNELFDLVTFNRYTVEFFRSKCLNSIKVDHKEAMTIFAKLITNADQPLMEDAHASDRDRVEKRSAN